jgi:DNA repair photolyase
MFVRWDNLTIDGQEQRALPGYKDAATVRTFDAPEAMDIRFYEVFAKSALNKVPLQSQMPFRWTVNPYRGCSHACNYCAGGETRVLLADGRTIALEDVSIGDVVYGTERQGTYRRFVPTRVFDKWSSVKPAFLTLLDDGTELITSGDHRFLSGRGWKYVTGAEQGAQRRPHLTLGTTLLGPGGVAQPPRIDDDYRRGYVCGMVRGDGNLPTYTDAHPARAGATLHRFRLALTDTEALSRTSAYLEHFGVLTRESEYLAAGGEHRAIRAIRTQARGHWEQIAGLVAWPRSPTESWEKGFLAGVFDAEGSCQSHVLRIANGDAEIIAHIEAALNRFSFDYAIERTAGFNIPMRTLRIRGGLSERLRFFISTDPAITRKRTIAGAALKSVASRKVVEVRPLGVAMRLYDLTTGTGDYIADGVIHHNCFARPTHKFLDMNPGRDFEREIVVKVNVPEALRKDLAEPSWTHEHVALGTNTDPYQWVEGRYKLMEGIWEAMRDAANPCSVLTKSPLLLRDVKLMQQIKARASFSACLSIPTLDEKAWRETEPHTPNPKARIEAVAELNRAGIPTGVLIAPLMPGINDSPQQVERLLDAVGEAGARSVGGVALHLRGEVRDVFMDWMRTARPDLVPRYEKLYAKGAYAPQEERARLARMVRRGDGEPGSFRTLRSSPRGDSGNSLETGHERHLRHERRPRGTGVSVQERLF